MLIDLKHEDFKRVYGLEKTSHAHPWSHKNLADCFVDKQYQVLGYQNKAALIGYCIVQQSGSEADILNFIIDYKYQNQGYGYVFLKAIKQYCYEQGALQVFLEVRHSNDAAQALYEKSGFSQIGIRNNYYPEIGGHEDALLYCSQLAGQ